MSVEAALLVPVIVLVSAMATAGWRTWWATAQVQVTAEAAARAASQKTSQSQADAAVAAIVASDLPNAKHCKATAVRSQLAAAGRPAGVAGTVSVTITCSVGLADLLVPGLPGAIAVQGAATEAIDIFRSKPR